MKINKLYGRKNEKPLEKLDFTGGFCAIFRNIACIGDSLSSGEFQAKIEGIDTYHDKFEYSWGQYIARLTGANVYNFSRGGMTAKEYLESFAELQDFWNKDLFCNAYIIALGVNDIINQNQPVGTVSDICHKDYKKNKDTFIGCYAAIVQRYKEIQPNAKFFFVTAPRSYNSKKDVLMLKKIQVIRDAVYALSKHFDNSYVIDLYKYAPDYNDEKFKKNFFLNGHMNPAGYFLSAIMISSYIDYIVRHNFEDFSQLGFIGTDFYDKTLERK